MLSTTEVQLPDPNQLKTLTLTDLVIMNKLSVSLREQIKKHIDIDPFTTEDPFKENDDYEYSVVLDKTDTKRVICMVVTKNRCSINKISINAKGHQQFLSLQKVNKNCWVYYVCISNMRLVTIVFDLKTSCFSSQKRYSNV